VDADRRQLLGSALVVGAFAATPFWIWSRIRRGETGEATDRQLAVLARVSDIAIPDTDTPGAVATDVPAFVVLALNHGIEGTRPSAGISQQSVPADPAPAAPAGLYILDRLMDDLDAIGGDWLARSPARQAAVLEMIDRDAFAPGAKDAAWTKIKSLILTGYYTSKAGATQELQYELVPGRWDPDIALPAHPRAWSSDWVAVTFG
jgi:hypothetical protein